MRVRSPKLPCQLLHNHSTVIDYIITIIDTVTLTITITLTLTLTLTLPLPLQLLSPSQQDNPLK